MNGVLYWNKLKVLEKTAWQEIVIGSKKTGCQVKVGKITIEIPWKLNHPFNVSGSTVNDAIRAIFGKIKRKDDGRQLHVYEHEFKMNSVVVKFIAYEPLTFYYISRLFFRINHENDPNCPLMVSTATAYKLVGMIL